MRGWEPSLWLNVANPALDVPPGVHLTCYGPFAPPAHAKTLRTLLPEVDMAVVHHMIMFAGKATSTAPATGRPGVTNHCYKGSIVYAWARTGQTTPIGLDFAETGVDGDGFAVGPGTKYEWFALQIHYQQLGEATVRDRSGIALGFSTESPARPLEVQLMASWRLKIPPRVRIDECVACRITSGGTAVAWRNHAHRLARDIYSEHYGRGGEAKPLVGNISSQLPQIFRVLPQSVQFEAGESILLHCQYDATSVADRITYLGVDERTHEMCNQYLMATAGLKFSCQGDLLSQDGAFRSNFAGAASAIESGSAIKQLRNTAERPTGLIVPSKPAVASIGALFFRRVPWSAARIEEGGSTAASGSISVAGVEDATGLSALRNVGVGQVTGLAIDESAAVVYAIHRGANHFSSRAPIDGPAVLAFRYDGTLIGALAKATFVVPHGLAIDHRGFLWATDVVLHQVLRLDPSRAGAVVATLGTRGAPGGGAASFRAPTDVAVHAQTGEVYIADGYGNARVVVFSYGGAYIREWGAAGQGEGAFHVPHSIVLDRRGLVYVADRENARVQVFERSGAFVTQWVSRAKANPARYAYSRHVSSISYDPTLDIFVVCEGEAVTVRSPSGCPLAEVAGAGGAFKWPHDAVALPSSAATRPGARALNRTALAAGGGQYMVFIAELDGKKVTRLNSGVQAQS